MSNTISIDLSEVFKEITTYDDFIEDRKFNPLTYSNLNFKIASATVKHLLLWANIGYESSDMHIMRGQSHERHITKINYRDLSFVFDTSGTTIKATIWRNGINATFNYAWSMNQGCRVAHAESADSACCRMTPEEWSTFARVEKSQTLLNRIKSRIQAATGQFIGDAKFETRFTLDGTFPVDFYVVNDFYVTFAIRRNSDELHELLDHDRDALAGIAEACIPIKFKSGREIDSDLKLLDELIEFSQRGSMLSEVLQTFMDLMPKLHVNLQLNDLSAIDEAIDILQGISLPPSMPSLRVINPIG